MIFKCCLFFENYGWGDPVNLWRHIDAIGCRLIGRHFVGAKNISDILVLGANLKRKGYNLTYNLLGEHEDDVRKVEMVMETTRRLISGIDSYNAGNISCKPTLYGMCISKEVYRENIRKIAEIAVGKGIEIEIDAENYAYIAGTFEVFASLCQAGYDSVLRQAVQAHLKAIFLLMDEYKLWDKNLRIVKGAEVYDEDDSIMEDNRELINIKYLEIMNRNVSSGKRPLVATIRDSKLVELIIQTVQEGRFEFQMLYGFLGRELGRRIIHQGYPVRIYMPFTDTWCRDAWKGYGTRRARLIRRLLWQRVAGR